MPKLVWCWKGQAFLENDLPDSGVSVGRDHYPAPNMHDGMHRAHLQFAREPWSHPELMGKLSRLHMVIRPAALNMWVIADLSKNGVWRKGSRLAKGQKHFLSNGDLFSLVSSREKKGLSVIFTEGPHPLELDTLDPSPITVVRTT